MIAGKFHDCRSASARARCCVASFLKAACRAWATSGHLRRCSNPSVAFFAEPPSMPTCRQWRAAQCAADRRNHRRLARSLHKGPGSQHPAAEAAPVHKQNGKRWKIEPFGGCLALIRACGSIKSSCWLSGGTMKFPRRRFLQLTASAAALPAVSRIATAQTYPTRPITMVVPFAAGGGADAIARRFSPANQTAA
jgi:hypothetical protein